MWENHDKQNINHRVFLPTLRRVWRGTLRLKHIMDSLYFWFQETWNESLHTSLYSFIPLFQLLCQVLSSFFPQLLLSPSFPRLRPTSWFWSCLILPTSCLTLSPSSNIFPHCLTFCCPLHTFFRPSLFRLCRATYSLQLCLSLSLLCLTLKESDPLSFGSRVNFQLHRVCKRKAEKEGDGVEKRKR